MLVLRRHINGVYVVAKCEKDGACHIEITDGASGPVSTEEQRGALEVFLKELSAMRAAVWHALQTLNG